MRHYFTNDRGELLQAFSMWRLDSPGAQEAEAYGLKETGKWLWDLSVGEVYIEMDCLAVVQILQGKIDNDTELGSILMFSKQFLDCGDNFRMSNVQRQTNGVAHSLARGASHLFASNQLFCYMPTCIIDIIQVEMN